MSRKLTTDEFIQRCIAKHGNAYDYSRTEYVNQKTKIIVICPTHGEWECLPNNHEYHGNGCPSCGIRNRVVGRTLPFADFVDHANKIHSGAYAYNEDTYVNSYTPVGIVCSIHGEFLMKPNAHTSSKQGCPRCAGKHKPHAEWVADFRRTHGDKYEYPVDVINATTRTNIICPVHGEFSQTPSMHRSGQGCPSCAYTNHKGRYSELFFNRLPDKKDSPAIIYVWEMFNDSEHFIKVGITTTSVNQRIRNNKSKTYKITEKFQQMLPLYDAFMLEQKILDSFKQFAYTPGEQFQGRTECLLPSCYHDIITTIKEHTNV